MSRCRFADVVLDPEPSAGEEGVTKLAFRVGLTACPLSPPFRRGTWLTANVLHAAGCRVHSHHQMPQSTVTRLFRKKDLVDQIFKFVASEVRVRTDLSSDSLMSS